MSFLQHILSYPKKIQFDGAFLCSISRNGVNIKREYCLLSDGENDDYGSDNLRALLAAPAHNNPGWRPLPGHLVLPAHPGHLDLHPLVIHV